jgi:hypothetical protein
MAKTLHFYQVAGLNRTLRALPKTASANLRDASQEIADKVAQDAAARASGQGGVARFVAPTIKSRRDRVPVVKMGSSSPLPSDKRARKGDRQTVGDVIWGAEFGGGGRPATSQFLPWRGNDTGAGYFLWPTVRGDRAFIEKAYGDAILEATDEAAR